MYQLPSYYLHDMITSIDVLSSTKIYSKVVGSPIIRNNNMTTITTNIIQPSIIGTSPTTIDNNKTTIQRYKTELCRSYHENNFCKYGEKCQFAHGYNEIRSLNRHPKYKTILCRTYHCTGYCPYGPRCHFLHDECSETLSCNTMSPSASFGSDIRSSVSSSRSISPITNHSDDIFLSSFLFNKN